MAGSVNKVILVGNLGKDPESRTFANGGKVVSFSVATSENWKDRSTGERKEKTEWHNISIFSEGLARVAEQYLKKGSKVYLEGQLQTRKWQDQSGQDRYSTEVVLQQYRGELTMLDGKQRRIVRFGAKGELKGYLTPEGVPEPATIVPRSFKIDANDAIHVLDVFGARVLVLGPDGKYQRHLPFPEAYGFFSDLAVGRNGTIYLLDSVTAALSAAPRNARDFTPLGKSLRTHLSFATSIAVDGRGVLYVVDENGSGIVLVGPDGSVLGRQLAMGWTEGLLYNPTQMCLNDKGQVFIADRGNSRVQVFAIVR